MKKIVLAIVSCVLFLAVSTTYAQETKSQTLSSFTKINLEGNIEIHLIKADKASIKIETKNGDDMEDFSIEVRNNVLSLEYNEKRSNTPKFTVYLEHTGVEEMVMSGLISLYSEDVLKGSELTLKGNGMIKGEIAIAVKDFKIDSDGMTNLTISGTADNATFNIDGMGKIKAQKLKAKTVHQNLGGFTKVKVGS